MNNQQILLLLIKLLEEYGNMVVLDSNVVHELVEALSRSGLEKRFIAKLQSYLCLLREQGEAAIGGKGAPMEHLSSCQELCSMRFPWKNLNLRVLFAYKNGIVYLLCAFYERGGHRNTEYEEYTPIALERLRSLL